METEVNGGTVYEEFHTLINSVTEVVYMVKACTVAYQD